MVSLPIDCNTHASTNVKIRGVVSEFNEREDLLTHILNLQNNAQ